MKNNFLVLLLIAGIVVAGYLLINNKKENKPAQNENFSFNNDEIIQTPPANNNNKQNTQTTTPQTPSTSAQPNKVTGDDVNGTQIGLITSVNATNGNYSLVIDYVILDACPPINPGDECLVNNNPMLRTFEIDNNATVRTFNSNWQPSNISLQDFTTNFSTGAGASSNTLWGGTMWPLNWITIENGIVVDITPQYLP